MSPDFFGDIAFSWKFLSGLFSIIVIDLILAGDNAVVIAMAVRTLPADQRRRIIMFGAGAAVLMRVMLTFFVAQLLHVSFIKLTGGVLILWIAVRLFVEAAPEDHLEKKATTMGQAIRLIVIADISMSLDNMLAVAAASHGNLFLLLFGLALSIPFVVFTSNLLSILMDRYPIIVYTGAAILGKVGGEMIITDPFVVRLFEPGRAAEYVFQALFAAGVLMVGKLLVFRMKKRREPRNLPSTDASAV